MKTFTSSVLKLSLLFTSLILITQNAHSQEISLDTDNGWKLGVTGDFPVFLVSANSENYSSNGDDQFSSRIMSGFNPANITFTASAPLQNGIKVSGKFQIDNHLQGAGIQNDGLFESRIADISISGDFGTVNVGKGFGVYNSNSLGDAGSAKGVGRFAGPDAADATLGRIGTGYTYANFNPRIIYTTPNLGGFTLKAGLINPEKPDGSSNRSTDIETKTPRIEGQLDYKKSFESASIEFWGSALYQNVNVVASDYDYNFGAWGLGSKITVSEFVLQGSYSQTTSIGADGLIGLNISGGSGLDQADINGDQWYVEGTYDFDSTLFGLSYGEGSQDQVNTPVGSSAAVTNKLAMAFAHITITDNLMFMIELQNFESDAQADYKAGILGTQFSF